jgi:hypothetical protein
MGTADYIWMSWECWTCVPSFERAGSIEWDLKTLN